MVEAAAQRWDRNVIGYDMRQQVSLLRAVRDRYGSFKSKNKVASTMIGSPRRTVLTVVGVVMVAGVAVYLYRRRRKPQPKRMAPSEKEARLRETAELYRLLDAALAGRGAPRPSGTPPLTHALSLRQLGHPVAEVALRLTERYLEARFGKSPFSADERREFVREVRELAKPPRQQRAA